jgi:hypothetical protein
VGSSAQSAILAVVEAGVNVSGTRYIAGGGAAGTFQSSPGSGGLGGGGNGGNTDQSGGSGVVNTGSGGGGGGNEAAGGNGGSGIVIIRYSDAYPAASTTGSPSAYVAGGYRYFKFTASGTFTIGS